MCILAPWLLFAAVPTAGLYMWIQGYYRKTCRELGRLDSISSSPIFAQYSETLEGLDTVRAYSVQRQLAVENEKLLDKNYRAYSLLVASHRWLAVRIEAVGAIVTVATCIYASGSHGSITSKSYP
jgi:ABC-type bacteriocin/lantibiotic exporter with double-glycine peptidase domain